MPDLVPILPKTRMCSVEKFFLWDSTLTIEGVGQHLEGGFLEQVGWLAGQQG